MLFSQDQRTVESPQIAQVQPHSIHSAAGSFSLLKLASF